MRFLPLATFVILYTSLFRFGHLGIFVKFVSQIFMNISYMSLLGLLPENLWIGGSVK